MRIRLIRFVGVREDMENPSTGRVRRPAIDAAAASPPGHIEWLLIFLHFVPYVEAERG